MTTGPAKSISSEKRGKAYAEVALPVPLRNTFSYLVPDHLRSVLKTGSRVLVPFGKRHLTGFAVSIEPSIAKRIKSEKIRLKEILEVLDEEPLLTEEILALTKWTAEYYAVSWGEILKASLPAGAGAAVITIVGISDNGKEALLEGRLNEALDKSVLKLLDTDGEKPIKELKDQFGSRKAAQSIARLTAGGFVCKSLQRSRPDLRPKTAKYVRIVQNSAVVPEGAAQAKVMDALTSSGGELPFSLVLETAGTSGSPVETLAKHGAVEIFEKEVLRNPLEDYDQELRDEIVLTARQRGVLEPIENAICEGSYRAFLLHGVTGSGKTEVYIRAMKTALAEGRSALMLVPEIALTPVFSRRLRSVFGNEVAILHSSLSRGERFDEWRRIREGSARVVIGTRSAVFAPLRDPGLIVVDEEHDASYRQHEMPFYHGRDVAIVRAKFANAVVLLGSATPALESFHNARTGKYEYLELPERIGNRPMAQAEIIDLRDVFRKDGGEALIAPELETAIRDTYSKGEQSIILLNRRGFSQFVLCRSCGETIKCRNCDITLTYHRGEDRLVCHYCNYRTRAPESCTFCESRSLDFLGEGTEQLENLLRQRFPELRIERVDRDTTRKRKELERILADFSAKKIDMMIGTQMLAKGHDFPNVTLVGVVSVDAGLSLPDFRAAERTFQLLTQVAGRAGRGDLPGRVIIQTYHPEHYALVYAREQSYAGFYDHEIAFRERMNYPPFVALASILLKHPRLRHGYENAAILKTALDEANADGTCIVLGPAPAALPRLKGEHRLQILVKSRSKINLREKLNEALAGAEAKGCDMRIVFAEIDPVNLL